MVTQSLADFGRYGYKPRPAFRDWIERRLANVCRKTVTLLANFGGRGARDEWGEHGQKK